MAKVELLAHTCDVFNGNVEDIVAYAAKLCYSNSDIDDLIENQTEESIQKFINNLLNLGHQSPLEHVSFTFGIEGISRACSHQLVRHRIASYSQQSQRYVNLDKKYSYITPPDIERNEKINKIYKEANDLIYEKYKLISKMLKEQYLKEGFKEKDAEKKAIEDAKMLVIQK